MLSRLQIKRCRIDCTITEDKLFRQLDYILRRTGGNVGCCSTTNTLAR